MKIFRNSFFLISLILLLASGGALWFFVQQVFATKISYQQEREKVAELEERARLADALESRWETVQEDKKIVEKAILQRKDLPVFFETIEATASAAGVTETTTVQEKGEHEMRFLLQASGQFPNLYVFVTHLNVLPTLIFLEEVSFSFKGGASGARGSSPVAIQPVANAVVRVPLGGLLESEVVEGSAETNKKDTAGDEDE